MAYLEGKTLNFQVRNYLKEPLSEQELKSILNASGFDAETLLRKQEVYYKEKLKGKKLTEKEVLAAILKEPKLLQRPIVFNGQKAILCNPPELMDELL